MHEIHVYFTLNYNHATVFSQGVGEKVLTYSYGWIYKELHHKIILCQIVRTSSKLPK